MPGWPASILRKYAQCPTRLPPCAHPKLPQAIFTLLPLRVGLALLALARTALSPAHSSSAAAPGAAGAAAPGAAAGSPAAGAAAAGVSPTAARGVPGWRVSLRGDQLFDLLSAAMSMGVVLFLWNLNAGTLYFWMKVRNSCYPSRCFWCTSGGSLFV